MRARKGVRINTEALRQYGVFTAQERGPASKPGDTGNRMWIKTTTLRQTPGELEDETGGQHDDCIGSIKLLRSNVMAGGIQKAKGGKKQRKWGRNSLSCARYKNENRREKNKITHLKKHLKRFPDDTCAKAAVENCLKVIRGY